MRADGHRVTGPVTTRAHAAGPRIDLKVLVVSDGNSPVDAIEGRLKTEGVPYTRVDLTASGRPVINTAFLQDTAGGVPRAKYQAVVLPNADPFGNTAEMTALAGFEKQFGIRQFDGYVYPSANVGPSAPGYAGQLDCTTATVSRLRRRRAVRAIS